MRRSMRNRRRNLELAARRVSRGLGRDSDILSVAQKLWSNLDTSVSLGLSLLVNNGQLQDALRVEFDPSRYLEADVETARDDHQSISFLRKMPFEIQGVDREASAWVLFLQAEEQCRKTNQRIRSCLDRGVFPPRVGQVVGLAQHKISKWLRNFDARSWALRCRFGPGADALNKGMRVSGYHKLSRLSSTKDFAEGAQALVKSHPVWQRVLTGGQPEDPFSVCPASDNGSPLTESTCTLDQAGEAQPLQAVTPVDVPMNIVAGNQVTFVPKTALIDRSIAIEPGMNIFAQLGIGALLRSRLKHAGLNLNAQEPNQLLAYYGSKNGKVATIDLSSASDTIARELVRLLLPDHWFTPMDWCRSKKGTYVSRTSGESSEFWYEKFSSMGNGFTFELESLIFYSLALSCTEILGESKGLCRAYGDDIAIPTSVVALLEEVLSFCGFSVNPRKSFSVGCFRESCGADFFNGVNVRPYFQKEFCTDARSHYRLANGIRRTAYRRNLGYGCDAKFRSLWVHVASRLPDSLRDIRVPGRPIKFLTESWCDVESGDGGLLSNLDEALSSPWVRFNTDYQAGWIFAELQSRPLSQEARIWPELYLFGLYTGRDGSKPESATYSRVVVRGDSGSRLNSEAKTSDWFDLGPWV